MPKDVEELKYTTRENARSFDIYKFIIGWYKLPKLNIAKGSNVIDIGCGRSYAIPGLYEEIGPKGKLVCVDINEIDLQKGREYLDFWFMHPNEFDAKYGERNQEIRDLIKKEHDVLDRTDDKKFENMYDTNRKNFKNRPEVELFNPDKHSGLLTEPHNIFHYHEDATNLQHCENDSFDHLLSIWSFYQVKDKITGLSEFLRILRETGKMHMINPGNILILNEKINEKNLKKVKDYVWKGHREWWEWNSAWQDLEEILNKLKIDYELHTVSDFLKKYFDNIKIKKGVTKNNFPPGSCMIEKTGPVKWKKEQPTYFDFVSNDHTVFIPMYVKAH